MPDFFGVVASVRPDLSGFETVEDYLSGEIERCLGPFVALGSPEDYLQPLGAARAYADDGEWKRSFERLVHCSRAILLHPGSSRELLWEIAFVRSSGYSRKLFVVVGSRSFAGSWIAELQWRMRGRIPRPKWLAFRADMQRGGYQMPPFIGSDTALIAFDEQGQGTVYDCDNRPNSYIVAIQAALGLRALLSAEEVEAAAARANRFS